MKPYSLLVIDTTLASDNPLRFIKNLLEKIKKLIVTNDDKIRDEKLQYYVKEKQLEYQHYHLEKMISMNILQVKKYCFLIKDK